MPKTELPLEPYNADMKSAAVFWWGDDEVYIEQVEVDDTEEKRRRSIVLFGREGIPALITALKQFLGEVPMPAQDALDVAHGFHLFMDGNAWCAVGPHFRDLMQDRAGFGDTQQAAYEAWWKDNEHSPNFRAVVHSKPDLSRFTVHL